MGRELKQLRKQDGVDLFIHIFILSRSQQATGSSGSRSYKSSRSSSSESMAARRRSNFTLLEDCWPVVILKPSKLLSLSNVCNIIVH